MSGVPRCEPLALEYVAKMRPASGALNLHALAVRVGEAADCTWNLPVERGPAAMGVELVLRAVEGRPTPLTFVRSGSELAFVLSREGPLRPFVDDHPFFRAGQGSKDGARCLGHTRPSDASY